MVHFIFLLKTSHPRNITKFISQYLDHINRRYDFCKNTKNLDLNKRKGGKRCVIDSGYRVSGSSSSRPRRLSPVISPLRRGLRPNQGYQRDPQTLANRLTPFSPTAEPPEMACRQPWRLGGGARRYAGALRPVERDLGFPTAPVNYGEAS